MGSKFFVRILRLSDTRPLNLPADNSLVTGNNSAVSPYGQALVTGNVRRSMSSTVVTAAKAWEQLNLVPQDGWRSKTGGCQAA